MGVSITFLNLTFFFSSRRRHTRYWRDWSSDVCSSDLLRPDAWAPVHCRRQSLGAQRALHGGSHCYPPPLSLQGLLRSAHLPRTAKEGRSCRRHAKAPHDPQRDPPEQHTMAAPTRLTSNTAALSLARRVKDQRQRERGRKVYSLHAPEVECIGKGKAHKPYEFGVKVSVATPLHRCRGGQFVAHVKALPGNPYDGHTLAEVIPDLERTIGAELERIVTDAGYRGHTAPREKRFQVYVAGQKPRSE